MGYLVDQSFVSKVVTQQLHALNRASPSRQVKRIIASGIGGAQQLVSLFHRCNDNFDPLGKTGEQRKVQGWITIDGGQN